MSWAEREGIRERESEREKETRRLSVGWRSGCNEVLMAAMLF